MNVIEAQNALIAHLQGMPGRPAIAYPDGPEINASPRLVVTVPNAPQRPILLDCAIEGEAQIIARIDIADRDETATALSIATNVIAHFSPQTLTDNLQILQPPAIQAQFRADGFFHVPLLIQGRFYHEQ